MLKIIIGTENAAKYSNKKYSSLPAVAFNSFKKESWFKEKIVREIIEKIDKARVEVGFSVRSLETGAGYSVNDLSGGAKTLIMIHELPQYLFLTKMGDNCTDFLERIALEYEARGEDLLVVSNYLHPYKFNYIKEIYYVNWGITCRSEQDIQDKVFRLWFGPDHVLEYADLDDEPEEEREATLRRTRELIEEVSREMGLKND